MKRKMIALVIYLLLIGCTFLDNEQQQAWQEMTGRDEGGESLSRESIYRARIPNDWVRLHLPAEESIVDTIKANCEFEIQEDGEKIRIVVHNFPVANLEDRIPPMAQISRWKRQFDFMDQSSLQIYPYAHGGFAGFSFEGVGTQDGKEVCVLGWGLQLDSEHYQVLNTISKNPQEESLYRQMRADYTIKATGTPKMLKKHKNAIQSFARSFELIKEVPSRT